MPTDLAVRAVAYVVAILLVLAGLAWATHEFNDLRETAARVPGLEQAVADRDATLTRERAAAAKTQRVSREYQTDLENIRADRDRLRDLPARVVRVYVPAAAAPERPRGATAGRPGVATAAPVALEGTARSSSGLSRDLGPELYRVVDDSDERESVLRAQVIRLQEAYGVAETTCNAGQP